MRRVTSRPSAGFTLIELLVVIAIIGLLANIVLFSVSTARQRATHTKAVQDLRAMQTALDLYYQDNGDWPPINGTAYTFSTNGGWNTIMTALKPYLSGAITPAYTVSSPAGPYAYAKGTALHWWSIPIWDETHPVACLEVHQGIWLDFWWDTPDSASIAQNDGGVDPEGFDVMEGDVRIKDPTACANINNAVLH